MTLLRVIRSRKTFEDRIKLYKKDAQNGYQIALDNFTEFAKIQYHTNDIISELKQVQREDVFEVLQAWINYNSHKAPSSILQDFSKVRRFLHYMGITMNTYDIKDNLIFPRRIQKDLYPLKLEEIQRIFGEAKFQTRALFTCQLSSGMRIGELVQLKPKYLDLETERITVKIPASITKLSKARTTFFSKEAGKMIRTILKKKEDNELIFGTNNDRQTSVRTQENKLRPILNKLGLDYKYEDTGRYKINTHSFRAYFITRVSRHDPNLAKMLTGQKGYLLQYDRMSDEEKLAKYIEIESDLLIDQSERIKAEKEKLEAEKSDLENRKEENKSLKTEMARIREDLEKVKQWREIESKYKRI